MLMSTIFYFCIEKIPFNDPKFFFSKIYKLKITNSYDSL